MGARATVVGTVAVQCATSAEPGAAGRLVDYASHYPPGEILISQSTRKLYFILDAKTAIAYPVGVAKPGKEWNGPARVLAKYVEPAWSPPGLGQEATTRTCRNSFRADRHAIRWAREQSHWTATRSQSTARPRPCAQRSAQPLPMAASAC